MKHKPLTTRKASTIEDDVFAAITAMCAKRIRDRLHFHMGKLAEQPLKTTLIQISRSLSISNRSFAAKLKPLIQEIDSWTRQQTPLRLRVVVDCVHQLSELQDLREMLDSIPNRQMDPSLRNSFWNTIRKVARYRQAAKFLCRSARQFVQVRQMKSSSVSLPQGAFPPVPSQKPDSSLSAAFERVFRTQKDPRDIQYICRLLGIPDEVAENNFGRYRDKATREAKMHAEVQLIFYLETSGSKTLTRVICSSKKACYLCNVFIAVHAKFHTPRSHGRLYPAWRLPLFLQSDKLEALLIQSLEFQINCSIKTLLSKRQRISYPFPNESTVLTLPLSTSTSHSPVPDIQNRLVPYSTSTISSLVCGTLASSIEKATKETATKENAHGAGETKDHCPLLLSQVANYGERFTLLDPGKPVEISVEANTTSAVFEAWSIRCQIEYTVQPAGDTEHEVAKGLACSLEWLKTGDSERVRRLGQCKVIDALSLDKCIVITLNDLQGLCISTGETLIRIQVD